MVTFNCKAKKPITSKCKKYCKDYATCQRKECKRKLGWDMDGDLYMMSDYDSNYINSKMKFDRWKEPRVILINDVRR